jgi:hypothetical protein
MNRRAAILGGASLVVAGRVARADDDDDDEVKFQKMRFIERGDVLTVTTSVSKLFDTEAYAELTTGFTSTVVVRMYVYPKDSQEPISFVLLERKALFNVWDEEFEIRISQPGTKPAVVKEKRQSDALKLLTNIEDVPIAQLADLPLEQQFLLAMQVELNPVSKETLAEVRRWLTQGTGGGIDRGGAFFGSFVSVFVNPKIPEADRTLRLQSQPFYRPRNR